MEQSFCNQWQFIDHFDESFLDTWPNNAVAIDLPHSAKLLPLNYFDELSYQRKFTYRKVFTLPNCAPESVILLVFQGVMVQADLYLNNINLGHFVQPYLPFQVDVTKHLHPGENILIVVVDGTEDKDIPPFGGAMDFLTFAGIYRGVDLLIKPAAYIDSLMVDASYNGDLLVKTELISRIDRAVSLSYRVLDQDGHEVAFSISPKFKIENPHLWKLDDPYLYTLEAKLYTAEFVDLQRVHFGFRHVRASSDGFFLNGQKTKIVGLNRHQSFAYFGYAADEQLQALDVKLLKQELGLNAVRCSHYPPSTSFLDACDQLGLLVIDEVPGWQHIGTSKLWHERHLANVRGMILRDYNHPSVIMYSIRINESGDHHDLYTAAQALAKQLDPRRPTTGVRNFVNSELLEDVYSYNDFVHFGPNRGLLDPRKVLPKAKRQAPYLVTESNGHMYPTKTYDDAQHRLEHVKRHLNVLNANYGSPRHMGAFSWCFVDYQTHGDFGSGDHICYHGVYDIFRNPKAASYVYTSQLRSEPLMEVVSSMDIGDFAANTIGETYVLTNCDYLDLFKNDKLIDRFYPSKKRYPHLPHPPIIIDNYVQQALLTDERFSKRDAKRIREVLGFASVKGMNNFTPRHKMMIGMIMLRYKLAFADLFALWGKYVSGWGSGKSTYCFKGYKDGQLVATVYRGPKDSLHLAATPLNAFTLNASGKPQTIAIRIQLNDQYGSVAQYSTEPLTFTTSGPITVYGPTVAACHGGQYTVYLRTTSQVSATYQLTITSQNYGAIQIEGKI